MFVIVNDKAVAPFSGMVGAPNALVKVGALMTFNVPEAVFPLPPFVELMLLVALVLAPSDVPLTSTLIVQVVLAPTVPPVKLIAEVFCVAVVVPPQVMVKPFGVLIFSPAGSTSLKANPLRAAALPLVIV